MEYVHTKRNICIPCMPIEVKFFVKEELELNSIQIFLLEAIQDKAAIGQIAQAAHLTDNVIENELLQLESQGLVSKKKDTFALTELSKKILLVGRMVQKLNKEKIQMSLNLITGDIERMDQNQYVIPDSEDLVLKHKIIELDGISIEDNMSFFSDNMQTLHPCTEEDKETVLSSIYVEIRKKKSTYNGLLYKRQSINRLPCLIGDGAYQPKPRPANMTMEGSVQRITFSYIFPGSEEYKGIIPDLRRIQASFPKLLSEEGNQVMKLADICKKCEDAKVQMIYDCTSGKMKIDKNEKISRERKMAQMTIREAPLEDDVCMKMKQTVRNYLQIDPAVEVCIHSVTSEKYYLQFPLEELWEEA